jgi:serine phosphatase RsbU (regulator of sigma subunit)/CheY-like chemotaxis protein
MSESSGSEQTPARAPSGTRGGRGGEPPADILVVDDTPAMRYVVTSWLRRAGHRVIEASTGSEALHLVATRPVDLAVLDVGLPDMSGNDVCERIKADPRTQAVPVVHVSATAVEPSDRTRGLTRGADAYLTEPIDPDELLATVHALLRYFRARHRAERLASRLARLAEATFIVNAAETFRELLESAATGAALVFDHPAAAAGIAPSGKPAIAWCRSPGEPVGYASWAAGAARVEADATRSIRLRAEDSAGWPELIVDAQAVWTSCSRAKPGRPPVYVVVPADDLTPDDGHVLTQFGQAVALAGEAQRTYDEERRTALTLQHSLLPRGLPTIEGIDLAARYVPATERAEIGGDFYEVLPAGRILTTAVGDVAGHSLHAATVMGELRHVLRAYVTEGHPPAEVLSRLNNLMMSLLPAETATVCMMALDLDTGVIRLANAGHLPPVLSLPGSGSRLLGGRVPLLGTTWAAVSESCQELPPGGTLVFVTDGLIERRGVDLTESLERLRVAAQTIEPDLDAFCDRLLAEFVTGPIDDDIAILVVRRAR